MSGAMSVEMILRLVDQATGPLRGVVSEVEKLDKAAKNLGNGAANAGGMSAAKRIEQLQAEWKAQQDNIQAVKDHEKQLGRVKSAQRAMVDAAIARELGRGSMALLHHGAVAGAEGAHSEISLETQGNSVEQIREIQDKAAELSRQFKAFDKTKIETMLGDAKTFVGSLEHAMAAMPDLLRLRTIQQGQHGTTSDEEFNSLTKALEVGGVAADEKKLHERLETFAKIMNVFKETIHPGDFTSFYNQAGIAARTLSDNFMRGAGAHLMQEMGGGGAGNAVNMFMNALEAGTMQPKAMETMDRLGLLDPAKIRKKANGEIRWIDPGGVQGGDLARTDPDMWIDKVLRPALEKLSPEKRDEAELALFSNSSVRKLVDKVLNQKSVVDKDRAQVEAAPGLEAADTWAKKDPTLAAHAVGAQFENLMRDAGKGLSGAATGVLNWMAEAEAGLSSVAKDHPVAATVAGLSAAAAGFWASLKLAQQAMMKAGSWFGQGAGGGEGAGAAEAASTAAKAAPKAGGMGTLSDLAEGFKNAVGGEEAMAELGHNAGVALKTGLVAGVVGVAADYAARKAEEKLFGWTPENTAKAEENIRAKGREWREKNGLTLVGGARAAEIEPPVQPKADTSQIEGAADKAKEAGEALKGLDISVAPKIDLSALVALNAEIDKALLGLKQLAATAKSAGASAQARARLGASPSTGSLHDGPEAH